jgi:hypothetical protein
MDDIPILQAVILCVWCFPSSPYLVCRAAPTPLGRFFSSMALRLPVGHCSRFFLFSSSIPRHKNPKDTKRECEATDVEDKKRIKGKLAKAEQQKKESQNCPKKQQTP